MKFTKSLIKTTKEAPKDALLPSHKYLIQGSFISQNSSGLYNILPLGKIVLENIKKIVKEELDDAQAVEAQLSFVTPLDIWEKSGRANLMKNEMLRFTDRKNNKFVLSPTNEEAMVELIKKKITSYKDLPINIYQINTKFRDEARPRFGLLRSREFLMKDGYSFHSDTQDMQREFDVMEQTYSKILTRLGLDFRVVDADSGAIGGSKSKEFMVLSNNGEDTIVVCENCEYSANIEAAVSKKRSYETKPMNEAKISTPNIKTIDEVASFFEVEKTQIVKAVIKKAIYENETEIVVFFINANDDLEETKACNSINAIDLADANEDEISKAGLIAGFVGLNGLPKDVKYVIDVSLKDSSDMIFGANEKDYHLSGQSVCCLEDELYFDLCSVKVGDICSCCDGTLTHTKGIEVGHIFQLGTKYSEALDANFLDKNGKTQPFEMATYGIGVSRLIAAIIEQNHDDKGCIWTNTTTPYFTYLIVSNGKNEEQNEIANDLYKKLRANGISVLIDDRKKESFGFKMKDFELLGFPYALIVGKQISDGIVEVVNRKTSEKTELKIEDAVEFITSQKSD